MSRIVVLFETKIIETMDGRIIKDDITTLINYIGKNTYADITLYVE